MATVTSSIGATSRDYSTISLWEDDLDDSGVYDAGDDAVGECYDDADFTETPEIVAGDSLSLNTFHLTAASGEAHDGTAGSGVTLAPSSGGDAFGVLTVDTAINGVVSLIEISPGNQSFGQGMYQTGEPGLITWTTQQCIIHDITRSVNGLEVCGVSAGGELNQVFNNFIYDVENTGGNGSLGIRLSSGSADRKALGNTIGAITGNTNEDANGIQWSPSTDGVGQVANNLVGDVTTSGTGTAACFNVSNGANDPDPLDYNASDDTSAEGANSLTSITFSDQVTSTADGSEDYRLQSGCDVIDEGMDYVATIGALEGVELDILGRDRDAQGDTWDIGAHELVAVATGPAIGRGLINHGILTRRTELVA